MIFTIGYAGRSLDEFVDTLRSNGITEVIDVRAFPTSKYEDFKGENLRKSLSKNGISYLHLKELGGYRRPSYSEFMKTEEFKKGLDILLKEARGKNVAIMCLERSFRRCHRRFIAERLGELEVEIMHL
jgi:uncharacterized protein (DUF488 family)